MQIQKQIHLINIINNLNSSNTDIIRQAQKQLNLLQSQPYFLELLVAILRTDLSYNLKKMVGICLQKFINKNKQSISNDLTKQYLELISSTFGCAQVDFKVKILVAETCTILLKRDQQKGLLKEGFKAIQNNLHTVQSVDLVATNIDFTIVFATMLLNCMSKQKHKSQMLSISDSFVQLAIKLFQFLSKNIAIRPNLQIQNILIRVQQLLLLIKLVIDSVGIQFFQNNKIEAFKVSMKLTFLCQFFQKGFYLFQGDKYQKVHRFFWLQSENSGINQCLNSLKTKYLQLLTSFVDKVPLKLLTQTSNLINLIKQIAKDTISHLQTIFYGRQRYQGSVGIDQVIQKQILFLITLCTNNQYNSVLYDQRIVLLRTIYKIFDFCAEDLEMFREEPYLFVNNIFRIIEVSLKDNNYIRSQGNFQSQEPLQLQNVKILAAKLFKLILNLHQSIVQDVCKEIINQIYSKITNRSNKIAKLTLILCIIRDCVQNREDILDQICRAVILIGDNKLPLIQKEFYYKPIDYALGLFALSSYLKPINLRMPLLLQRILQLSVNLISQRTFPQIHRILGQEIIQNIYQIHHSNFILIEKMLEELNRRIIILTNNGNITYNILESLFFSIEQISKRKKLQTVFVQPQKLKIVQQILNSLRHCIQVQLKRTSCDKLVINKCWNIIKLLGQNEVFVIPLISTLENVINYLIDYISIFKRIDFEEDCFLLMTSFIQHSQKISNFVLGLFQLIPSIFYGQYRRKFGHSFQAMQMLIYYGKNVLMEPKRQVLTSILQMSLESLLSNEFECIEGVLLLQSLMLTVQDGIGCNIWKMIVDKVKKKLALAYNNQLLRQNLLGLLGISYKIAKVDWFEFYQINQYIRLCSQDISRCTNDYRLKVISFSFCELILKNQKKCLQASSQELKNILEHLIKVKWSHQDKKNILHNLSDRQNEKQFQILKCYTVNKVTKLNFEQYFKTFVRKFTKNLEHYQEQFSFISVQKVEGMKIKKDIQTESTEFQKRSLVLTRRYGLK